MSPLGVLAEIICAENNQYLIELPFFFFFLISFVVHMKLIQQYVALGYSVSGLPILFYITVKQLYTC